MATEQIATANAEAIEAWDGVLFDRFVEFRHIILPGTSPHSDQALREHPPQPGDRALDIGCGFGDTTQQLGELVGAEGRVLGVDASARFVEAARAEAAEAGAQNVRFEVADVEAGGLAEEFDYAFSRFGTMFFANPVAALRNVRAALAPAGRLCMVVWRKKLDNPWFHEAEQALIELGITEEEDSDQPTCGPGPFSMANADTTSDVLTHAGFGEIGLRRCDLPIRIGADLDEAVAYVTGIGPAGELVRLAGAEGERRRTEIDAAIREVLAPYGGDDGVWATMSTWLVSARVLA